MKYTIRRADLRIDTFRAGGPGGQHQNKTDSAVRITHKPTGIVAECRTHRSQHMNKSEAYQRLAVKIGEHFRAQASEGVERRFRAGSERVRNYHFERNEVKDPATGVVVNDVKRVLDGNIDPFVEARLKAGMR